MESIHSLRLSSQNKNYGLDKLRSNFVVKFAKILTINYGIKYPNVWTIKFKNISIHPFLINKEEIESILFNHT